VGKLMREILEKAKALEVSKEIETAYLYSNLNAAAAEREVLEQYKKAQSLTDQDKGKEPMKELNNIITDSEDLDNGQVYDKLTGNTIREL